MNSKLKLFSVPALLLDKSLGRNHFSPAYLAGASWRLDDDLLFVFLNMQPSDLHFLILMHWASHFLIVCSEECLDDPSFFQYLEIVSIFHKDRFEWSPAARRSFWCPEGCTFRI